MANQKRGKRVREGENAMLLKAIRDAYIMLPSSMGGRVTLALNILQNALRKAETKGGK